MPTDPEQVPSWLQEELQRCVHALAAIERPSASPGERQAAAWIAAALKETGLRAEIEVERAHGGYWWPLGLLNAASALSAALALRGGGRLARLAAAAVGARLGLRYLG